MSSREQTQTHQFHRCLLELARGVARRELGDPTGPLPQLPPGQERTYGGVFATFLSGQILRGCIGTFASTSDLSRTVPEVVRSALADPRFVGNPITAAELPGLNIEISLLSELAPVSDPARELVPGVHGIVVRRGDRSGCFLPNVASQRGWSAQEFLSNCCTMKANLPADAWRLPDTNVLLFTAEGFCESEFV